MIAGLIDRLMGRFLGDSERVEYRVVSVSWKEFCVVRTDDWRAVFRGSLSECEQWLDRNDRCSRGE